MRGRALRLAGMAVLLTCIATEAGTVGLGPLINDGVIDGPREAFYLTLYNPYETATDFVAYSIARDSDAEEARVAIFPARTILAARSSRRILVVADDLAIGETHQFRVCAQRRTPPEGIAINARVCSKFSARRLG